MLYFLNLSYNPNTASTNRLLGYYNALEKMGIEATVVFLLPDSGGHRLLTQYKHIKVKYYWNHIFPNNSLFRLIRFKWNLWRFVKLLKAGDLVYTYDTNQATQMVSQIKHIQTYTECTEHPSVVCYGKTTGLDAEKRISVMKQCDGLFVISRSLKEYFISRGVEKSKIHIINMTVDPSRFKGLIKQSTERYIAYCGKVSNNKDGVDELIKAFSIVAKCVNDIYLYIIGETPNKDDEAGNLSLIDNLKLKDRIKFIGVVSAEQMPQLLKNAEVLALARPDSLQAQCGFPTKLGEYLLTENPVVVTKVGDIPKFLKDGESALLAEERNAQDFSRKLLWALQHPSEAAEIGKKGAELALREFNSEFETRKMLNCMSLYNNNFQ